MTFRPEHDSTAHPTCSGTNARALTHNVKCSGLSKPNQDVLWTTTKRPEHDSHESNDLA